MECPLPCCRSPMWMMRAMSWALGSWSSLKLSSFFTRVRGTPSDGHTSAFDATATIPTCFHLRAAVAVRPGKVNLLSLGKLTLGFYAPLAHVYAGTFFFYVKSVRNNCRCKCAAQNKLANFFMKKPNAASVHRKLMCVVLQRESHRAFEHHI